MSTPHHFIDIPSPRHPVRWAVLALGIVAVLVATAAPANGHAEHEPLPDGFQAQITQVLGPDGQPAPAAGPEFTMAPDGGRLSVSYRGAEELIIFGEQANEPLVRIAGGVAHVNAASPQATKVDGASVDPAAAAELIDLVWDRVPPAWEPITSGATVSFMDHRAVPGHPPVRADYREGEVAATWSIPFSLDGADYTLNGEVVAVEQANAGLSTDLIVTVAVVLLVLLIVGYALREWRRITRRGVGTPADGSDQRELVRAG